MTGGEIADGGATLGTAGAASGMAGRHWERRGGIGNGGAASGTAGQNRGRRIRASAAIPRLFSPLSALAA